MRIRTTKSSTKESRNHLLSRLRIIGILLLGLPAMAYGQSIHGSLSGIVQDSAGIPVGGASIQLSEASTGVNRSNTTLTDGNYSFQELSVGVYRLTVQAGGFEGRIIDNIHVGVGNNLRLPLQLTVASVKTTVTVSASSLSLDKVSSNLNSIIPDKAVQDMPLNGRDFTQLVKLAPGVNALNSINGGRTGQNLWLIDGIDNTALFFGTNAINSTGVGNGGIGIPATVLPIDAIDQFAVVAQGTAEYGRSTGGVVNLVTKSGTNKIHGSLYYFNRNDALAVGSPFATTKPKLKNNQFGGSVGGPVIKDHLFYFLTYERQKLIAGNSTPGTEPSQAYVDKAAAVLQKYGTPQNQVATNLLEFWPAYGRTGPASPNNFTSNANQVYYSDNGLAKIDYTIDPKNTLSARYFIGSGRQSAYSTSAYPDYFQVAPTHAQNLGAAWTLVPTSRMLNQVTMGINVLNQKFHDANLAFNPIAAGLNTEVSDPALAGAPNMTISGFDAIGGTPPIFRTLGSGQIGDQISYDLGQHQFKMGLEYRRFGGFIDYERNKRGTFTWNGSQGPWAADTSITDANVKSLADFLAGYVATSQIARGQLTRDYRQNGFEAFVQDTYRALPDLNISLGLHYSYYSPIRDLSDSISTFIPSKGGLVNPGGGISSLYPGDKTNFGPRFGFAYSPSDFSRVVFRGGFGILYNQPDYGSFVDNRPSNNGTAGVEANPFGPDPVYTLTRTNYTLAYGQPVFGSSTPTPPFAVFSVSQNYKTNYSLQYNLNAQVNLTRDVLFQAAYVGTGARHLPILRDINQAATSSLGTKTTAAQALQTRPYYSTFPQYATINELQTTATSNYNSLQLSLTTAEWKGLTSQVSYTFGHSLDLISNGRGATPTNSFDLAREYASSDFDMRHTLSSFVTYKVPKISRVGVGLGQGWQVNAFMSFHSGQPFTVYAGQNVSGTFEGRDRVNVVGDPFANVNRAISLRGVQWFNASAFIAPAAGTFGNESRNAYVGPGFGDVDLSIFKETRIHDRIVAQFRVEMFNVFNRTNLAPLALSVVGGIGANTQLTSSSVGRISQTVGAYYSAPGVGPGEPYNTQLALKLQF